MRIVRPLAAAAFLAGISPATPAAQQALPRLRLEMPSFATASYGTAGASALYVGYSLGPVAAAAGMVLNPRTGYRELVIGAVTRLVREPQSLALALALADAPESAYLQAYVMPALQLGPLSLSGTLELYRPLQPAGTAQLDLSPVRALVPIAGGIGLGAGYTLGLAEGEGPRQRAGPVVQVGIPRGALIAELRRNLGRARSELRLTVETGF